MNNTLIPIASRTIAGSTTETVHARKSHEFLGVGRDYSNWIKARIKQYSFVENEDFILIRQNGRIKQQGGDQRSINHHITLDMVKELAMVERNEKGHEARRYFIGCEKQLKEQAKTAEQPKESISQDKTIRTMTVIRGNNAIETCLLPSDAMVISPSEPPNLIRYSEFFPIRELPKIMKAASERILKCSLS